MLRRCVYHWFFIEILWFRWNRPWTVLFLVLLMSIADIIRRMPLQRFELSLRIPGIDRCWWLFRAVFRWLLLGWRSVVTMGWVMRDGLTRFNCCGLRMWIRCSIATVPQVCICIRQRRNSLLVFLVTVVHEISRHIITVVNVITTHVVLVAWRCFSVLSVVVSW